MTARHNMLHLIATGDHKLMRKVNKWPAPKWVRLAAIVATRAGDGWLWYLTGLTVLLFGGDNRIAATAAAGSAAVVGVGLFVLLKRTGRKRPCEIEPHCWSLILPPDKYSFPSGHTITAFGIALSLGLFYPQLQGVLLAVALLIASSRIILGMHFLSDVLAGAALGSALGVASIVAFAAYGLA